jgi:tripartite-type tricarboxylate transporter receptor subunit TctC
MRFKTSRRVLLAATLFAGLAAHAAGPEYPTRPVTVIVGFSAGGPTDVVARMLAEQLTTKLGQTFLIDNRAGANGGVAAQQTRAAAPDGYTLMIGSSGTLSITPGLRISMPYDVARDFTPIALVASYPYFLVVPTQSPATDVPDLIRRARSAAAPMSFASAGTGSVNHLAGEWFKSASGFEATHVPYKGDSASMTDLMAGRVDFAFISGAAASSQVRAGKLRALAVASEAPGRGGPGVPTMIEAGVPGFSAEPWNGLMGPAGMPPEVVAKLNAAVNEIMQRPDMKVRLLALEQYPMTGSPAAFAGHIASQTKRWGEIIRIARIPKE